MVTKKTPKTGGSLAELIATFAYSTPNMFADYERPRMCLQSTKSDFKNVRKKDFTAYQEKGIGKRNFFETDWVISLVQDNFNKTWSNALWTAI